MIAYAAKHSLLFQTALATSALKRHVDIRLTARGLADNVAVLRQDSPETFRLPPDHQLRLPTVPDHHTIPTKQRCAEMLALLFLTCLAFDKRCLY